MSSASLPDLPDFLTEADGEVRLKGHRIGLVDLLYFYREGYTPEMLAAHYPSLTLAEIHYVLGFYHQHQQQVDGFLDAHLADISKLRNQAMNSPQHSKLRQRLQAMRKAQSRAAHAS